MFSEGRGGSMFKKCALLFLAIGALAQAGFSQHQGERAIIGKKEVVRSVILNEERNVNVFLPEGYSTSQNRYPVLYMLYSVAPRIDLEIREDARRKPYVHPGPKPDRGPQSLRLKMNLSIPHRKLGIQSASG